MTAGRADPRRGDRVPSAAGNRPGQRPPARCPHPGAYRLIGRHGRHRRDLVPLPHQGAADAQRVVDVLPQLVRSQGPVALLAGMQGAAGMLHLERQPGLAVAQALPQPHHLPAQLLLGGPDLLRARRRRGAAHRAPPGPGLPGSRPVLPRRPPAVAGMRSSGASPIAVRGRRWMSMRPLPGPG